MLLPPKTLSKPMLLSILDVIPAHTRPLPRPKNQTSLVLPPRLIEILPGRPSLPPLPLPTPLLPIPISFTLLLIIFSHLRIAFEKSDSARFIPSSKTTTMTKMMMTFLTTTITMTRTTTKMTNVTTISTITTTSSKTTTMMSLITTTNRAS